MSFEVYDIVRKVKEGKIELCFYYDVDNTSLKHGYMYKTLRNNKSRYDISFATWCAFSKKAVVVDGSRSNLDSLCTKTKKWCSDMMDKNAMDTILDFMEDARWFECDSRESTLSHIVSEDIKKGIFIIHLKS